MKQVPVLTLVLVLVLACLARDLASANSQPIYTLAQVGAGLRRDPAAWIDRTLLVRARIGGFSYTGDATTGSIAVEGDVALGTASAMTVSLMQDGGASVSATWLVLRTEVDRQLGSQILVALHGIPRLGSIVPWPLAHLRMSGVYRVRLFHAPSVSAGCCYDGLLLLSQ